MKFAARMARRGYWHEAEFRWAKVMAERPNDPELWNNLAVAHESLGNFSEALRHYKRALELAPNNRQIRQNYARFAEFYSDYSRKEPEQEPPLLPKEDDPFRRR